MFDLTMCHCLRKLFNVGSLFKLLFAYNTFVPFSFTGESTTTIYSRFTSLKLYAMTAHSSFTASRYPSFQVCKTPRRSAKQDSCIY